MNTEDLNKAVDQIDDDLLEEAAAFYSNNKKKNNGIFMVIPAAAASVAVIIAANKITSQIDHKIPDNNIAFNITTSEASASVTDAAVTDNEMVTVPAVADNDPGLSGYSKQTSVTSHSVSIDPETRTTAAWSSTVKSSVSSVPLNSTDKAPVTSVPLNSTDKPSVTTVHVNSTAKPSSESYITASVPVSVNSEPMTSISVSSSQAPQISTVPVSSSVPLVSASVTTRRPGSGGEQSASSEKNELIEPPADCLYTPEGSIIFRADDLVMLEVNAKVRGYTYAYTMLAAQNAEGYKKSVVGTRTFPKYEFNFKDGKIREGEYHGRLLQDLNENPYFYIREYTSDGKNEKCYRYEFSEGMIKRSGTEPIRLEDLLAKEDHDSIDRYGYAIKREDVISSCDYIYVNKWMKYYYCFSDPEDPAALNGLKYEIPEKYTWVVVTAENGTDQEQLCKLFEGLEIGANDSIMPFVHDSDQHVFLYSDTVDYQKALEFPYIKKIEMVSKITGKEICKAEFDPDHNDIWFDDSGTDRGNNDLIAFTVRTNKYTELNESMFEDLDADVVHVFRANYTSDSVKWFVYIRYNGDISSLEAFDEDVNKISGVYSSCLSHITEVNTGFSVFEKDLIY